MNKETFRMQMLAGIITEGQYKEKINEEETPKLTTSDIETLKQHARMMNQQAQLDSDSNLASGTPPTDYSGGEDGGVSGAGGGSLPPSPGSGHLHTEYGATVQLQNHQLYSGSVTPGGTSGPDADISKLTSADSRQTVAML